MTEEEREIRRTHAENGDAMTLLVALAKLKGSATIEEIRAGFKLLDDSALARLRAKQEWEAMSALAVLREWGDPRGW